MRKAKKLLSIVLCLCMILTTIGTIAPVSVSAAGLLKDGSVNLTFGDNDYDKDGINKLVSEIVDGFAGKAASDKVYKVRWNKEEHDDTRAPYCLDYTGKHKKNYVQFCDFLLEDTSVMSWSIYLYKDESDTSKTGSITSVKVSATGINIGSGASAAAVAEGVTLPTSISVGEWHNFAIEFPGDGSKDLVIYLDGVAYQCVLPFATYGQYCVRPNFTGYQTSDTYLDNYGYSYDLSDPLYDTAKYAMVASVVTEDEIVTYDSETKKFEIVGDALTVAEFKEAIETDYEITVYKDKSYQTVLEEDDLIASGNAVVLCKKDEANKEIAYRYYETSFKDSSIFNYSVNADGVSCTVTGFKSSYTIPASGSNIEIPEEIAGYTVTAIADNAFRVGSTYIAKGTTFDKIIMPDTIKTIGNSAFYDTYAMIDAWPTDLEKIGSNAFTHGKAMPGDFSNTKLKEIGSSAFAYATRFSTLVFPDTLEEIGSSAFVWSSAYTVNIPDSVTSLGATAFGATEKLHTFRFPRNDTYKTIASGTLHTAYTGTNARYYEDMSIYIPETITTIPDNLLEEFKDGKTVTIYGAKGSAAEKYYNDINALLAKSEYTNGLAIYGTGTEEDRYKDVDEDGKGELAAVKFVPYDFDTDTAAVIDESGYNFGNSGFTVTAGSGNTENDANEVMQYTAGLGGKASDDYAAHYTSIVGGSGINYNNSGENKTGTSYTAFQTRGPANSTNYVGAYLYYYGDENRNSSNRPGIEILKMTNSQISFNGSVLKDGDETVKVVPGRWYTIVIEVPNDGEQTVKLYVNGKMYTSELAKPAYGQYCIRSFVNANSSYPGTMYYDNYRAAPSTTIAYNPEDDKIAEIVSSSEDIVIDNGTNVAVNGGTIYVNPENKFTAAQFKENVSVGNGCGNDASMRIYSDDTYTAELADTDYITNASKVVVATKNYYSFERVLTYYDISPLNNTKFAIEIISEENKTARVTGFNATTVTDEDDFSTLEIPATIMDYTITEIAEAAFFENEEIENVILPASVEVIGANAFCGKFVNDDNDKQAKGSIKSVVLPAGIKTIGSKAFAYNAGLTQITFPEGLETIASQAFMWSGLEEVILPDSVKTVGTGAFIGYSIGEIAYGKIKTVDLSANLKSIGANAFSDNGALTQVTFPEGLETIGDGAFAYSGLEEVSLPDSVTTIGKNAFTGYSVVGQYFGKIKTVKLSANLKSIGSYAFSRNPITEIEFPDGLEEIGSQAFWWTNIKALSIPNSVTSVGYGAFRLAPLKFLKLSSGITSYNNGEFSGANIDVDEIIIPQAVTQIGPNVFRDQDKLEDGKTTDPNSDNTGKMSSVVYGVKGSYAETWANKYSFGFKEIMGDMVVASAQIYGDGSKALAGTDYDLKYGYENLTFKARLINIASEDKTLTVKFTLTDENGVVLASTEKDIEVQAEKERQITEMDGVMIDVDELKAGYTAKVEITNKADGAAMCAPVEYNFSDAKKEVHALLIANSFGNDSFGYINKIAEADGVVLKVQNMYIGSAPLTKHYRNMSQNLTTYQPVINGVYGTAASASVKDALESDKWDVVALQAATHGFSADYSFVDYATWADDAEGSLSGTPNVTTPEMLNFIKDYVQTYAPNAKRVMHMSWGPCEEQSRVMYDNRFADEAEYPSARQAVYELQKEAYEYASSIYSSVDGQMVPTSIAVQYALNVLGYQEHSGELVKQSDGSSVYEAVPGEISIFRDETCHLTSSTHYGRVLAGLTWYEYLTGNDVTQNPYQHAEIPAEVMAALKEAAHWANQQVVGLDGEQPAVEVTEALVNVSVIGGSANVFVNGEDKGIAPATASYAVGTALKYVATPADSDKEFLYWAEASPDGKLVIVSDKETFEITVGSNVTYTAIYADAQDAVYVTFKANNKILVSGNKDMVEIPANPYMTGYVFDAWYTTAGTRFEAGEIIFSELTANTTFIAGFKAEKTAYTVSVTGANEQGGEFVYNSKITLTPAGEDGKYFAYWMRDGKIVCYTSEYTFYVSGNTNVEAVYADKEAEKQIVLVMAEPVIVGDNLDKIGFYAERNVPDGYTIAETGIIMSQLANFDINTSGVIKAKAKSTAPAGQFTVRKGNAKGQTWYAKAYLIYSDGEKSYTVYSNTVSKTVK